MRGTQKTYIELISDSAGDVDTICDSVQTDAPNAAESLNHTNE